MLRAKVINSIFLSFAGVTINLKDSIISGSKVGKLFKFYLFEKGPFFCSLKDVQLENSKKKLKPALLLSYEVEIDNSEYWLVESHGVIKMQYYASADNYFDSFADVLNEGRRRCKVDIIKKDPNCRIKNIRFIGLRIRETATEPIIKVS